MADTESDPAGAPARSDQRVARKRRLHPTLRLRLTLLYGVVFVLAGAGLLTATYALFKHSQGTAPKSVRISGVDFTLPRTPQWRAIVSARAGGGGATLITSGTAKVPGNVTSADAPVGSLNTVHQRLPPSQLIKQIQSSGQTQLRSKVSEVVRQANVKLKAAQANDASSLLEWSAIALGVVALLSIGIAWWLSGRALRPLRTMNARAREISAESLHQRLGVGERRDELGELATTFDALLARLEAAFESQRRFVANASHELRTPITLERTLVEVALADPDVTVDSLRHVCERVVASTEEQERLLDALLTLARSEAGVAAREDVDLAVVAGEALLAREPRLAGITVESALEPARVRGDQALLERLVGNLLDNAIVHNAGEPRWVRVTTGELDGVPCLRISNGGEAVPAGEVGQLFEPFRRGVGERLAGEREGLGLGLSIVRAVAVAHGARIEARALPEGGLEFELRFGAGTASRPAAAGRQAVPV